MKRILAIVLVALFVFTLASCGEPRKTEDELNAEALALGQEILDSAIVFTGREQFEYELYENSNDIVRFQYEGFYYHHITNFEQIFPDFISNDVMNSLKTQIGLLITNNGEGGQNGYIRIYDDISYYDRCELVLAERGEVICKYIVTYYYVIPADEEGGEPVLRADAHEFAIKKGYIEVTGADGTVTQQEKWQIIDFTDPWEFPFTSFVIETEE